MMALIFRSDRPATSDQGHSERNPLAVWYATAGAHTLLTFANFSMVNGFSSVAIVALYAIVAVTTFGVVSALETNTATFASGQEVQLFIELTGSRVVVTIACYKMNQTEYISQCLPLHARRWLMDFVVSL